ncbi:VOC family protein [Sinomonas sp. ASV486]|uniref:VOC family protein n=1 Tax=Sinomonas sp. ASV486 TaxID=3051170 RepID=UPI0027DC17E5|nr:VOC family protein [Sinomonas sp. ASV486]MDQ4490800.1 VOC family protein [Sinomonas sp. ASV486]
MHESNTPAPRRGLPGITGTDHIGFTVPDIQEAHEFLVDVIGCDHVYSLGPYPRNPELMSHRLNVHPGAVMREIRFYRCFNGANFEVFNYESPDQRREQPKNTDVGGHHIAFYVEDIDEAIAYLKARGVQVLGEPTRSSGASEGQRWVYFLSPWGMQFELVSFPLGKAYESNAPVKLWKP